ncbi:hypothetical protein CYMTET_44634 [Cymbomonas tetramitiformis]|uniref:Uncharacterized protein n=1 Tax=Cymbomonas tetramitiformis TaxID=36881 RepID=A0AAE0EZ47_9CHLO|nr:hypothetical protein CYMTET_44634 [Cymbomonas tetramitiformis]
MHPDNLSDLQREFVKNAALKYLAVNGKPGDSDSKAGNPMECSFSDGDKKAFKGKMTSNMQNWCDNNKFCQVANSKCRFKTGGRKVANAAGVVDKDVAHENNLDERWKSAIKQAFDAEHSK